MVKLQKQHEVQVLTRKSEKDSDGYSIPRITTMFIQINERQICLSTLTTWLLNYNGKSMRTQSVWCVRLFCFSMKGVSGKEKQQQKTDGKIIWGTEGYTHTCERKYLLSHNHFACEGNKWVTERKRMRKIELNELKMRKVLLIWKANEVGIWTMMNTGLSSMNDSCGCSSDKSRPYYVD